jgi:plastocyanin
MFILTMTPNTILIAPGLNESYATLNIEPLMSLENVSVTLNASANPGLQLTVPSTAIPYDPSVTTTVPVTLSADSGIKPGNYNATITAHVNSQSFSQMFPIDVVQALVVMDHEAFIPSNITVPEGTTIVWMNIDTEIGCCDPGFHTVTFLSSDNTTIPNMGSPVLHRFDVWSYEFSNEGVYHYYCIIHPSMQGYVNVTA